MLESEAALPSDPEAFLLDLYTKAIVEINLVFCPESENSIGPAPYTIQQEPSRDILPYLESLDLDRTELLLYQTFYLVKEKIYPYEREVIRLSAILRISTEIVRMRLRKCLEADSKSAGTDVSGGLLAYFQRKIAATNRKNAIYFEQLHAKAIFDQSNTGLELTTTIKELFTYRKIHFALGEILDAQICDSEHIEWTHKDGPYWDKFKSLRGGGDTDTDCATS